MRGFHSDFKKGLTGGLRPDYIMVSNSALLSQAINCRLRPSGLEGYSQHIALLPTFYDYLTGVAVTLTYSWPFPQLFNTDSGFYVCTKSAIYRVWGEGTGLKSEKIITLPIDTVWPWTLADCPKFPVFANGDYLVYYDYDLTTWISYSFKYGTIAGNHWNTSWHTPLAACYFRGQILLAGSNDLNILDDNKKIRFSDIGVFDFLGRDPAASAADILRNIAGEVNFSSAVEERVLRLAPLGKCVIAYGQFAIQSLTPVQDPAPTYSPDEIADYGIACPLAVGVGKDEHIFVCRTGHLWKVAGGQGAPVVSKLGYLEWLGPLQTGVDLTKQLGLISILYNPTEKEYYISNGTTSYIYNSLGLTQGSKAVYGWADYTNVASIDTGYIDLEDGTGEILLEDGGYVELENYTMPIASSNVGLYVDDAALTTYLQLRTDAIDFSLPAIKTIESVDLDMDIPAAATVEVMVEWVNSMNDTWHTTTWKRCNPAGMCYPLVSGVLFRINVRVANYYNTGLDTTVIRSIGVSWKQSDKTGIRGARQQSADSSAT